MEALTDEKLVDASAAPEETAPRPPSACELIGTAACQACDGCGPLASLYVGPEAMAKIMAAKNKSTSEQLADDTQNIVIAGQKPSQNSDSEVVQASAVPSSTVNTDSKQTEKSAVDASKPAEMPKVATMQESPSPKMPTAAPVTKSVQSKKPPAEAVPKSDTKPIVGSEQIRIQSQLSSHKETAPTDTIPPQPAPKPIVETPQKNTEATTQPTGKHTKPPVLQQPTSASTEKTASIFPKVTEQTHQPTPEQSRTDDSGDIEPKPVTANRQVEATQDSISRAVHTHNSNTPTDQPTAVSSDMQPQAREADSKPAPKPGTTTESAASTHAHNTPKLTNDTSKEYYTTFSHAKIQPLHDGEGDAGVETRPSAEDAVAFTAEQQLPTDVTLINEMVQPDPDAAPQPVLPKIAPQSDLDGTSTMESARIAEETLSVIDDESPTTSYSAEQVNDMPAVIEIDTKNIPVDSTDCSHSAEHAIDAITPNYDTDDDSPSVAVDIAETTSVRAPERTQVGDERPFRANNQKPDDKQHIELHPTAGTSAPLMHDENLESTEVSIEPTEQQPFAAATGEFEDSPHRTLISISEEQSYPFKAADTAFDEPSVQPIAPHATLQTAIANADHDNENGANTDDSSYDIRAQQPKCDASIRSIRQIAQRLIGQIAYILAA